MGGIYKKRFSTSSIVRRIAREENKIERKRGKKKQERTWDSMKA